MARAKKQPDGSIKVVDGPPLRPAIDLAVQQIVAAGGKVWGDERGLLVADDQDRIIGVFGDLSGLEWNGAPLPAGTKGIMTLNGYFAGLLAANTVHYNNLVVAFAKVDNVTSQKGTPSIEHVAEDQEDWNVIKIEDAFADSSSPLFAINILHEGTPLSTLVGSYYVQLSADGEDWHEPQHLPWISSPVVQTVLPDGSRIAFGHILYSYRLVGFVCYKISGAINDLWIRFKRHAVGE